MKTKEKAQELFDKYFDQMLSFGFHLSNRQISKIAIIAVDEILDMVKHTPIEFIETDYWQEVKQEIENL